MKRNLVGAAVLSAALCFTPAGVALAQTQPGGQTPQSTMPPGSNPGAPGAPGAAGAQQPGMTPETSANTGTTAPKAMNDNKFVKEAAEGGMAEVELGKLAQQKGATPAVKQFGERMVTDHTKANDELKQIASKDNIAIPTTLDHKYQAQIDKLSKLSGDKFDKAYTKEQLKDHEKDVKEFQMEAQNGTNQDVKQFASQTLPILQQHLDMAKNLKKSGDQSDMSTAGSGK